MDYLHIHVYLCVCGRSICLFSHKQKRSSKVDVCILHVNHYTTTRAIYSVVQVREIKGILY